MSFAEGYMKKQRKQQWIKWLTRRLGLVLIIVVGFFVTMRVLLKEVVQNNTPHTIVVTVGETERLAFFDKIKLVAQQNQRDYGVLTSITMAQAALESNFGTSGLASQYYNLFGVKGTAEKGVLLPTLEFLNGQYVEIKDYFAVYHSWDESIVEHGKLLYYGTPWNSNQYRDVIIAKNYHDAALGLVTGGYATDPNYATKIVQMIEQYQLHLYD